ncbi:MAG: hypothetical protein KDA47_02505, partial [Planctomycetales bacterium]|nr:hypothetical protein [Planctomycetales bacterium]
MSFLKVHPKTLRGPLNKSAFVPAKRSRRRRARVCRIEQLEARRLLIGSDWNNVLNPLNTTGDAGGFIAPNDVLV